MPVISTKSLNFLNYTWSEKFKERELSLNCFFYAKMR